MKVQKHSAYTDLFSCFSAYLEQTYKYTPLTAKVMAHFVLESNSEGFTFDELLDVFDVSKSSLSNSINFLLTTNNLEYINKINSRKRYFRLSINYLEKKLDFLFEIISQEIIFSNRIKEYKVSNESIFGGNGDLVIEIYLDHLNKTKNILKETIEKINKIQLEKK